MNHILEYAGLFAAAFLSATVLPFQSEVVLFGLLVAEHYQWWLLVLVASVGNTLGSAANWVLGRLLAQFEDRRWFPIKRETIKRAERWYHRYGRWSRFSAGFRLSVIPSRLWLACCASRS